MPRKKVASKKPATTASRKKTGSRKKPAARKQTNDTIVCGKAKVLAYLFDWRAGLDFIYQRVTDKSDRHMVLGIKTFFKWENHRHHVHALANCLDAMLSPGPYLWADIVENLYTQLFGGLRQAQIKLRIVDQDEHVRPVTREFFAHQVQCAKDKLAMRPDLHQADNGQFF